MPAIDRAGLQKRLDGLVKLQSELRLTCADIRGQLQASPERDKEIKSRRVWYGRARWALKQTVKRMLNVESSISSVNAMIDMLDCKEMIDNNQHVQ